MKKIPLILFWAICSYCLLFEITLAHWQSYVDLISAFVVIGPALFSLLITKGNYVHRLSVACKIIWLSTGVSVMASFIQILNTVYQDIESFQMSLAVALLPVFYSLLLSLLVAPLLWRQVKG